MRRRVLIITVGGTPQVVTETVYFLVTAPEPWFPDQIILATTTAGQDQFINGDEKRGLEPLIGANGRLKAMYRHLGLADRYVEPEVHPARHLSGGAVDDIRSDAQVSAFANTLLGLVRKATEDPATDVHLSLAGGRKTMSFIAGTVMSIYGRAGHVLSHVLVEPPQFESAAAVRFWWPGQPDPVPILDRDGNPSMDDKGMPRVLDAAKARVVLHPTPFIRLRAYLPDTDIFKGDIPYEAAVERANEALAIDRLVVDLKSSELRVGRYRVHREAKQIALLAVVAHALHENATIGEVVIDKCRMPTLNGSAEAFLDIWSRCLVGMRLQSIFLEDRNIYEATFREDKRILIRDFIYERDISIPLSNIRRELRKSFPPNLALRVLRKKAISSEFLPSQIDLIPPIGLNSELIVNCL